MLINLTPHEINIYKSDGEYILTVYPEDKPARVEVEYILEDETKEGVEIFKAQYGKVDNLPEPDGKTAYIVSLVVKDAMPERSDLLSPGALIRDEQGRPIGCKGLVS